MIKKIDHLVITTSSPNECIDFYSKLGFTTHDCGGYYQLFAGDFKINVHVRGSELLPKARNVQTGSADVCFELDTNLAEFKSHLQKMNIKIEQDIVKRHGTRGLMQSIYIRDFDGNLLEFCSYDSTDNMS